MITRVDKMKLFFAVIFALIALINAVSQPIIPNTRKEGCIEGTCGSHCDYDGVKLFPNDQKNQEGKCRILKCNKNFDVAITPCPFDSELIYLTELQCSLIIYSKFKFRYWTVSMGQEGRRWEENLPRLLRYKDQENLIWIEIVCLVTWYEFQGVSLTCLYI